jgi:hypothetical protein
MDRETFYRITIGILALVIVIMGAVIIMRKPPKPSPPRITKPTKAYKGKIAIVIDDLGYNSDNINIISGLKYPLTFSILPNLNYSKALAQKLHEKGFEIILHLPMEPKEKVALEDNTLLTAMDEAQIREIINADLASVLYSKGVSNHMGSLATENEKIMRVIFEELAKKRLYFLDSFVIGNSLGADLANKLRIKFAKRDVFLDNNLDALYIKQQIDQLKTRARSHGYAIGIGHDRRITLEVLKEVMPELAKEGYRFVFVSDLVR